MVVAVAAPTFAAEITVALKSHDPHAGHESAGTVVAVSAVDPNKSITASLPGKLELPSGEWFLTPRVGNDWSETRAIRVVDGKSQAVELDSYPATLLTARVSLPDGKVPAQLKVYFQRANVDDETVPAEGNSNCEVNKDSALCRLPAGELDLSFRVTGFVSRFRWGIQLTKDVPFDAGTIAFRPGSTLTGRVEIPKGPAAKVEQVNVTVRPVPPPGSNEEQRRRADTAKLTTHPNNRGLFAFDLPAGQFAIRATIGDLTSEEVIADVIEGHEAPLRESLRLAPQRSIAVRINPPMNPWSKPWRLAMEAITTDGLVVSQRVGSTSVDGTCRFGNLVPGLYSLRVPRAADQDWASRQVEITGSDTTVDIDIATIYVTGTIRMGTRPIEAHATLIAEKSGISAQVTSKADGTFAAQLPAPENDTWDRVTIESELPSIARTLENVRMERHSDRSAELDLEVPARSLNGSVVNELGEKTKDVIIDIRPPDGPLQQVLSSDGSFTVAGLAAGHYQLHASSEGRETPEAQDVVLGDDGDAITDVTLIVTPESHLRGTVRTLDSPVLGAVLSPRVSGDHTRPIIPYRTDPAGQFDLHFPTSTRQISLVLNAPGFAVRLINASPSAKEQTLAVDQTGGALLVDVSNRPGLTSYLFHDGAAFPAHGVAWIAGVGFMGNPEERTSFKIPLMEPGSYSVCWLPKGAPPNAAPAGCVDGMLAPHGSLVLKD